MPWISRRKLERLITMHTTVIDERLRESERKLANSEVNTQDLDRRLSRAELETNTTGERNREHAMRIESISSQMTTMTQSLQSEHERRWTQLEEQLVAHARRATEDRVHLEELIEEVRRNSNQRSARVEQLMGQMASRLDTGSDDTAGRVHALANEVARLSIDLRAEFGQALTKAQNRAPVAPVVPTDHQLVIDLQDPVPTTVDLR